jgi:hypothetical protein
LDYLRGEQRGGVYFGGVLFSLLPQSSGAEPAAGDEGWSTDGPA